MFAPLRPVGFDVPNMQPQTVDAPQQLPQPDTTGLQLVGQTNQQFQQTLQANSQYMQQEARAIAETAESQSRSAQAISQATAQIAQLKSASAQASAQSFNALGQTLLGIAEQYTKAKAQQDSAKQKQLAEAQYSAATQELENLRVDWIEKGRIDKEGTVAYRDAVANTTAKYQLGGEEVRQLTERYYAPALEYAKTTEANRQAKADEIIKANKRINVATFQGKLSASSAKIINTVGQDPIFFESAYTEWKLVAESLLKDESIPLLDRLEGYALAQENLVKNADERNIKTAQMQSDLAATRQLFQYTAEQGARFRGGEISASDYYANVKIRATELGLPGFSTPDPLQDQETSNRLLQGALDAEKIQRDRVENDLSDITAKDTVIGALVTQFQLSPTSYEALKNSSDYKTNANAKAAVEIFERWRTFRDDDTPKFAASQTRYASEMRNLDADFRIWFTNALRDSRVAGAPPGVNKVLEQLRANGDPAMVAALTGASQGRPLSQQDVDQIRQAYVIRLDAVREEARQNELSYRNREREFQRYGLYFDVNRTRAAYDKWKADLDRDTQRREEIRRSSTQAPDQPGNSPDFNGGSPGKPLNWKPFFKGNYGGKAITFPFGQGARIYPLEPGQQFGAPRQGRTHDGLDFATPVGTPTTSLVYGRIRRVEGNVRGYGVNVEVVGDDGNIYHYAHLSKVLAVEGQRVGPGEVIALTGNTDGGAGISTGPHLHLGIYLGGDYGKPANPLDFLASRQFGDRRTNQARNPRSAGNNIPANANRVIPKGAIPLGNNQYLYDGKILRAEYSTTQPFPDGSGRPRLTAAEASQRVPGNASGSDDPVVTPPGASSSPRVLGRARYTSAQPLRNSYAGRRTQTQPDSNHGYSILAKDRQFTAALNKLARKHNVEPQWLADMIAVETANTFDPAVPNGQGYFGLIQFGPGARQDLGVSVEQLTRMTRVQQLTLVDRYLDLQKRYAGVDKFRNVEELAAAIHMGHTELRAVRDGKTPSDALGVYIRSLGKYTGRQYDWRGNRRNRVSHIIHERPMASCTVCNAMLNQTGTLSAFFPHESQMVS